MNNPLVSIIIPTYNRVHLIAETLDAILAQTYTNWECIIVDDGSTDGSEMLIKSYYSKDVRFSYYQRPAARLKGANACRNFGFEKAKGNYIQWFDSDDFMLPNFIESKMSIFSNEDVDFVFSKTLNVYPDGALKPIYETDNNGVSITAFNFITQKLAFCTLDFMAKVSSLHQLTFNEVLVSGQEFNFFARYLFNSTKGRFIDDVLAHRRVHQDSIQTRVTNTITNDIMVYHQNTVINKVILLRDIMAIGDRESKEYLIHSIMNFSCLLAQKKQTIPFFSEIVKAVKTINGVKSQYLFYIAMKTIRHSGKGYKLYKMSLL